MANKKRLKKIFDTLASPEDKLDLEVKQLKKKIAKIENTTQESKDITGEEVVKKINELEMIAPKQIDFGHIRNFPWHAIKGGGGEAGNFTGYGAYDLNVKAITLGQITANQNNYVTGLGGWFRISSDAARTITGFEGGTDGRGFVLSNVGSFNITLANQSASSAAAYRIITGTGADMVLLPDDDVWLLYDPTTERWRVVERGGGAIASGTINEIAYFDTATTVSSLTTATYPSLTELSYLKTGALTSGSVLFFNGTNLAQDNSNFFWDDTNNVLGIGTNSPNTSADFHISDGNAPLAGLLTTDKFIITYQNVAPGQAMVVASNTAAHRGVFKGTRAGGTLAIPTVPSTDDDVVTFGGAIYDGTDTELTAGIFLKVDGAVSNNVAPQRISFVTSATSAAARTEKMVIKSSGLVGIANASPVALLTLGTAGTTAGNLSMAGLTSGTVSIGVAAVAGTWTFTLPTTGGTNTYALTTNGSGVSSWSQIDLTSAVTGLLPLANGGTNANLTASNGGIFYSTATAGAILAGTATAGLALVSGASTTPSWFTPTAGSVLFAGTGGILQQDNANFFWDDTNNRLGIGTASPVSDIHIINNTGPAFVAFEAHSGSYGQLLFRSAQGNTGSLTATLSGDTIGQISGQGYDGSTYGSAQANIAYAATENWSATAKGTKITFITTANTTTTTAVRLFIDNTGMVGIGSATPTAKFHISGALTASAWGVNGIQLRAAVATYTDTSSSGTVATQAAIGISQPTLVATNPTTYTDSATLYLSGAPIASTNVIQTNAYTLWIDAGTFRADGNIMSDPENARIWGANRRTTANAAGVNLTVQAGGATSLATDKGGGGLILSSGVSTGTGSSVVQIAVAQGITSGAIGTISATPTAPGTLYTALDVLTITTGDGTATVRVDTVDGGGGILTMTLLTGGSASYTVSEDNATSGGTGTLATVKIATLTGTADNAAANIARFGTLGLFIGSATTPSARLDISGALTSAAWTTAGIVIRQRASTYTDNTSSKGATVSIITANTFTTPTFAFVNTGVTITDATTLMVDPPAAGTNATITNSWTFNSRGKMLLTGLNTTDDNIHFRSQRAAITSGSTIGGMSFVSNDTNLTSPGTLVGYHRMVANETHTATALGTDFVWATVAATTTTLAERMRLSSVGLAIGTAVNDILALSNAAPIINFTSTNNSSGVRFNVTTTATTAFRFQYNAGTINSIDTTGRMFFRGTTTTPTAAVHCAAGTTAASTAPLKFNSGTNMTTAEAGAFEYDGNNLFFTPTGTTRQAIVTTNQGTDVASGTNITLTKTGNYFDITGTTTINTIATTNWQAGSVVILQFDSSVTVTHNGAGTGASILLSGSVNFSATANDTLTLVYDSVTWREVARTII